MPKLRAMPLLMGLAVFLAGYADRPAWGQAVPETPCLSRLPITFHVGLPERLAPRADPTVLRELVERATEPLARAVRPSANPCARQQRYEVILSIGSDYEVLDWLSQGKVDAGLVSSLGFWLLHRDHIELIDFAPAWADDRPSVQPRVAAITRSVDGSGKIVPQPDQTLNRYRRQLLCRAIDALHPRGFQSPDELRNFRTGRAWASSRDGKDGEKDTDDTSCRSDPDQEHPFQPVAPHHFSEAGFAFPLLANRRWLTENLAEALPQPLDPLVHEALERLMEEALVHDLRFSLDHTPFERLVGQHPPLPLPSSTARLGNESEVVTEILFDTADGTNDETSASLLPAPGVPGRDHWVLLASRAEMLLGTSVPRRSSIIPTALAQLPEVTRQYEDLFRTVHEAIETPSDQHAAIPPRSSTLASLLEAHRGFGTRTMAFTADEVLRLLQTRQRRAAREAQLALVLPGGGVKSTYQSVLLDRLYGSGRLRNAFWDSKDSEPQPIQPGPFAPPLTSPVAVHQVIGTSGGALIGYFVAQLDQNGPFNLTELLWQHPPDPSRSSSKTRFLKSSDIFGGTDILRYVSLVVSFAVLAVLLVFLGPRVSRRLARVRTRDANADRPLSRAHLYLTLGSLMALTPVLVASLSAKRFQEHIPEIEGLLYMVLIFLVMAADHCLVRTSATPGDDPNGAQAAAGDGPTIIARLAISIGVLMMLIPLVTAALVRLVNNPNHHGTTSRDTWVDLYALLLGDHASVAFCFIVLSLPAVFVAMALSVRVAQAPRWAARGPHIAFFDYLICSTVALSVLWLPDIRFGTASVPILFWGLAAPVLLWMLHRTLRRGREEFGRWRWRATYYGGLTAACAALVALCSSMRPDPNGTRSPFEVTSRLGTLGGSLLITAGAVTVGYGLFLWFSRPKHGYRIHHLPRFAAGLAIVIGHAAIAQAAILLLSLLKPNTVPTLELDVRFWGWLLALTTLGGVGLLAAVRRRSHGTVAISPDASWLRTRIDRGCRAAVTGVTFLIEPHPNGPARCWRLLAVCMVGLAWWNLLLAPALYGNRLARQTLERAVDTFERVRASHRDPVFVPPSVSDLPRFTAAFVAPANQLAADGTRFFLFRPAASSMPAIPEHSRSGSRWLCHRMAESDKKSDSPDPCPRTPTRKLLLEVIFASGSPFPIFAPHRVVAPLDDESEMVLIDGGYSNVVPVEAAHTLGSDNVLVLRSSSHPAFDETTDRLTGFIDRWLSPLFKNLGRLPAFVFERSQRVDRLSGQDLFVVSLAPARRHGDWPALYHFQSAVIERLEGLATADLQERIGFVESWGQPHPVVSVPLRLPVASASAHEAMSSSPPAPAPAHTR